MKIENMGKVMADHIGAKSADFVCRCIQGDEGIGGRAPKGRFAELWESSRSWDEWESRVMRDRSLAYTSQAWGVLARVRFWDVLGIREDAVVRRFVTECDGGSLMLGDAAGTFAVSVPNGRGDGAMDVVVVDPGPRDCAFRPHGAVNHGQFSFVGTVEGAFQVYGYDCDGLSAADADLRGRYAVYVWNGTVVLERWR